MPRPRNRRKSVRLGITTPPQVVSYLDDLVDIGLHGSNPTEVAERLVVAQIQHLIETGVLTLKGRPRQTGQKKVG